METKEKLVVNAPRQLNGWEALLLGMIFLSSVDLIKCWINSKVEREKLKYGTKEEETKKRGIF